MKFFILITFVLFFIAYFLNLDVDKTENGNIVLWYDWKGSRKFKILL